MATLAEIYIWFMTGKKPTQAQFRESWGSFWHKLEKIPISVIDGLTGVLNAKTENSQFEAHKVAADAHQALFDFKENKNQKGTAGGYAPLNELATIAAQYLNIVNDLTTGGTTALASAETVKSLKIQIEAIQTLLSSDNINLDTVQELVDAIEAFQNSTGAILVNDLTTGGTTKALTAEMGKFLNDLITALNTNKVDKIPGDRLITAAEITKLAGLGNMQIMPAPYLEKVVPDSVLPSTTRNITLKGSFLTPTTTVAIAGQTVNSVTFVSDNELTVNITTGAAEASFNIAINNGLSVTFSNALLVSLGTVFIPVASDYTNVIQPIDFGTGIVLTKTALTIGSAVYNKALDSTKKYNLNFSLIKSPLVTNPANSEYKLVSLVDQVNGNIYDFIIVFFGTSMQFKINKNNGAFAPDFGWMASPSVFLIQFKFYWDLNQMFLYRGTQLMYTFSSNELPNLLKTKFTVSNFDITDIKYIELP